MNKYNFEKDITQSMAQATREKIPSFPNSMENMNNIHQILDKFETKIYYFF